MGRHLELVDYMPHPFQQPPSPLYPYVVSQTIAIWLAHYSDTFATNGGIAQTPSVGFVVDLWYNLL